MLMTRDDPGQHAPSGVKTRAGRDVETSRVSHRVVASICILGLAITALSTWAAWRVDRNAEERLLQVQTRQAAAVLSTAVLVIQQPLTNAVSVQSAIGGAGDPATFERFMSTSVGEGNIFVAASLWSPGRDPEVPLAAMGVRPAMEAGGADMQSFLDHALSTPSAVVRVVVAGEQTRIAWALADPESGFVVYAERAVPDDRRSPVDRDAAFADLDYAIYVGEQKDLEGLSTTNVDPASLPLDGNTFEETIPFGDTVLTLQTNPRRHLGASLSQQLPWILLATGLFLTAMAALVAHQLVRGRRVAESHTETITALYEQVDSLYEEERALFVRLQRALLPQTNPEIPRIEIAAEYVAGTQGIDIGGDWYSVIGISDEEFAFVVGDVSGRGVDAVAVMAHARFTLRAYLVDGQSPSAALEKCSRQFDISLDGHMTTALVGVGNWRTGVVTLANAGHPAPLLVTDDRPEFVVTPIGPPLGTGVSAYDSCEFTMPIGSTLILYTDGLIERRTEDIAAGMDRLANTVAPMALVPLETMVGDLLTSLNDPTSSDDIAVLALRRVKP